MKKLITTAFILLLTVTAGYAQCGVASYYGGSDGFHGKRTASGEIFNMYDMTAAHRSLPFGAIVKVTSQRTGKEILVKISDRGPFHKGRVIDLSKAAAKEIGIYNSGIGPVCLERIE